MLEWSIPLWGEVAVFAGAAAVIGVAGPRLADLADRLADRTGLGEALTGTIFLGLITALPGLTASVAAAFDGQASLALNNAMGGIAVQTVALAVADAAYRKANLEHAAASAPNLVQTVSLLLLLTLPLTGIAGPDVTLAHVHPTTVLLLFAAGAAFWLTNQAREEPMWHPRLTPHTVEDVPDPAHTRGSLPAIVTALGVTAAVTALSGAVIAESAENLVELTGLSAAVVGGAFMAIATSLPELVTSVAAVRKGAVTLAVGGIVGGNFFDVLFVAAADLAYLEGSLYHGPGIGDREVFLIALTQLLNIVLLGGLLHRQRAGPAGIGLEGVSMIALYVAGFLVLSLGF